jgi:4-diphosphocytidyl-2-C-methyl-D-erythritol kinase
MMPDLPIRTVQVTAPAKINLFLEITGKRTSGYHILDSLFTFSDFGDVLHFQVPANEWSLSVSGDFASSISDEPLCDNLILKAARLLSAKLPDSFPTSISLDKAIPVAAGLGGGSVDAAACLLALQQLWPTKPTEAELQKLALQLGADVPASLLSQSQIVRGIGDDRTLIADFPSFEILLVNPRIPLSTKAVFQNWTPDFSSARSWPKSGNKEGWLDFIHSRINSLQATAIRICPEIQLILTSLNELEGCQLARMSGSGPSCFAIFNNDQEAHHASRELARLRPNWWVKQTRLSSQTAAS